MRRFKGLSVYIIVAFISMTIGAFAMLGCSALTKQESRAGTLLNDNLNQTTANAQISQGRNTAIVKAVQAVAPAVVGITNKGQARDFFNRKVIVDQGTGSGIIFDTNGYIVTNYHVVARASTIIVSLADGRTLEGKVIGADPITDLAVVKVDAKDLPVAAFGDSDSLMVGEPAIAIGNPLGLELRGSVTSGVISALNRPLDVGERSFKLIQTDAAINPGNSGGALVNADGLVVGINSIKIAVSGVEGLGFAIPINDARPILKSLIENGRVIRPYLAINVMDRRLATRAGYEYPFEKGIYIVNMDPNGSAAKSGLAAGDVILSVAGQEVSTIAELRNVLDSLKVNTEVDIVVQRDNKTQTFKVRLQEMPNN
ncbi:trypsin-like peptidase domain-containing protein [Selenomonadales bacterium OttesenSCG-928-I06]|nr:trypsin-like peptidase domain-containing protein [Selenomonadales bacterium OttesenSCG-928-I06]